MEPRETRGETGRRYEHSEIGIQVSRRDVMFKRREGTSR